MTHTFPYLKKYSKHAFQEMYTEILWHRSLSYGAKIYALSLLTVPPQTSVKLKRLAVKLGTYPSALSRWREELKTAKVHVRDLTPIPTAEL